MPEPVDDEELAAYQAMLLELMFAERSPDEIVRRLASDPRAEPFRAYVRGFDRRCIEATATLMRRWGLRARTSDAA